MTVLLNGVSRVAQGIVGVLGERVSRARRRRSVAVLVDADGVSARRFTQLLEAAQKVGRVTDVRVYGPVALLNSKEWRDVAASHGVLRVPNMASGASKGSAGIRIAVDAMDLMAGNGAATFVLASSNVDFTPLARKLHATGKRVIGIGCPDCEARHRKVFDELLEVDSEPDSRNKSYLHGGNSPRSTTLVSVHAA